MPYIARKGNHKHPVKERELQNGTENNTEDVYNHLSRENAGFYKEKATTDDTYDHMPAEGKPHGTETGSDIKGIILGGTGDYADVDMEFESADKKNIDKVNTAPNGSGTAITSDGLINRSKNQSPANTNEPSLSQYIGPEGDVYSSVTKESQSTGQTGQNEPVKMQSTETAHDADPVRNQGPQGDLYTEVAIQR